MRKEADAFARGDFADPEQIHGRDMPGVDVLRAGYDELELTLTPTSDGARIRYRSEGDEVVDALHRWFKAQLMDHGDHAEWVNRAEETPQPLTAAGGVTSLARTTSLAKNRSPIEAVMTPLDECEEMMTDCQVLAKRPATMAG